MPSKMRSLRMLILASLLLSGLGPVAVQMVSAQSGWMAYNDSAWYSGQPNTNITQITIYGTTSGLLGWYSESCVKSRSLVSLAVTKLTGGYHDSYNQG
jgi:hypothetical protein